MYFYDLSQAAGNSIHIDRAVGAIRLRLGPCQFGQAVSQFLGFFVFMCIYKALLILRPGAEKIRILVGHFLA
jgi:hypothetical protein